MSKPFDYVMNLNAGGANMMRGTENDELAEKGYQPFLTNRSMSYHYDTVILANMVNQWAHLDNLPQYEFYKSTVRKKKRFGKWQKPETSDFINTLMEKYSCNKQVAEQYDSLLTNEQKQEIIKNSSKGGK